MTFVINLIEKHRKDILSPIRQQFIETPVKDKNFRFVFDAEPKSHFDMLISFGKLFSAKLNLPKQRCVFVTPEPPDCAVFPKKYLEQYGFVVTPFKEIYKFHPNLLVSHPLLPFMYDWDSFQAIGQKQEVFENKINKVSVITSTKTITKLQKKRVLLIQKLKNIMGDKIDIYGNGFKNIRKKSAAIKPYKYHLAIENSNHPNYWTEKIADAYLGGALPFYYGCENIDKFFEPDSFIKIDINDADKTAQIMLEAIENNAATKYKKNIEQSAQKLYQKYNTPAELVKIAKHILEKEKIIVAKNNKKKSQNTVLRTGTMHIIMKAKIFIKKIFAQKYLHKNICTCNEVKITII